jgi:hypothetical protein
MALKNVGPKPRKFKSRKHYTPSRGYWWARIAGQSRNLCRWSVTDLAELDRIYEAKRQHYEALARDGNRDTVLGITILERDRLTVNDIVNRYLEARLRHVDHADPGRRLAPVTFRNYQRTLTWVNRGIGDATVASLNPAIFARMMARAEAEHGTAHVNEIVTYTKMMFKWSVENRIILTLPFYGTEFTATNEALRQDGLRHKQVKLFTAAQIRALLNHADARMKAMILLGINAAYLQSDCAALPIIFDHPTNSMDLTGAAPYIRFDRVKTGERRKATLWRETVEALQAVIGDRREGLVFSTRRGFAMIHQVAIRDELGQIVSYSNCDPMPKLFRELSVKAGIRPAGARGLGFSAMRSTCETIMVTCPDLTIANQAAIAWIMGHRLAGTGLSRMADRYLQDVDLDTLALATNHVHKWLFEDATAVAVA